MNFKHIILILQVGFLLTIFGAATFYFQYAALKKAYTVCTSKNSTSATEKNSGSLPLAEEENESTGSATEEEEQSNDRSLHEFDAIANMTTASLVRAATAHLFVFKEIHFEIFTPPPQV
jgi:hypothetical protein